MRQRRLAVSVAVLVLSAFVLVGTVPSGAAPVEAADMAYTTSADFAKGTSVNLNSDDVADQLQLNKQISTFPFIWIALSDRETIAKVDTRTGDIVGEYRGLSEGAGSHATSRTTVSIDGSVWVGHRFTSSITHVGLREANQCVDRNGNGVIDTSTGYGNVLPWPGGTFGATAPSSAAADECILHAVDTPGGDSRHLSLNADGDVWVGSFNSPRGFSLIDSATGTFLLGSADTVGQATTCGGYGGLTDGNGVVWSANGGSNGLLRWNPSAPVDATNPECIDVSVYGLAIDGSGWIWVNEFGSQVRKVSPDGDTILGPFSNGSATGSQGLAVDGNGDVWISSSLSCSSNCTVGHLRNDGTFVGNVPTPTGSGSTGIAVDAAGKIWAANINSSTATRIDPNAGPFSTTPGLETVRVGAVDLTVGFPATVAGADTIALPEAHPYNYSDMTGTIALGNTAPQGSWSVVQDGGSDNFRWHTISFNNEPQGFIPPGASISLTVEARAANSVAGLGGQEFRSISNCVEIAGLSGRFVEVRIILRPNSAGDSPVLSDVWIRGGPGIPPGQCVAPTGAAPEKANGYLVFTGNGAVHAHGDVTFVGAAGDADVRAASVVSPTGRVLNAPIVGGAVLPNGKGYYLVAEDGGVFAFGQAPFKGSMGGTKLNKPISGMALDPDGSGYWLVATDGGVFSFDARFAGSMGATRLNQPINDITADPDGKGYWLVADDGGVFSFDASFAGSLGSTRLNQPITGIAADPDGAGYWLVAKDGGVFAIGAKFAGSLGSIKLNAPVSGIAADPDGAGYWLVGEDGGLFAFDAAFYGSDVAHIKASKVVGIAAP